MEGLTNQVEELILVKNALMGDTIDRKRRRSKAEFESFFFFNLFIYLAVPGLSCNTLDLSCGIVGSSLRPRMEPEPPTLGV